VAKNHRERLFAATVAVVAAKGYEATRVEDLCKLSGVSRGAFYRLFEDKRACFLAAVGALVGPTIELIGKGAEGSVGEERAREIFHGFLGLLVEQSAAARVCFVELYAAGPEAIGVLERAIGSFEESVLATLEQMPGRAGMPRPIVRAIVGGLYKVVSSRLYREEEGRLSELEEAMWKWRLSYLPPPGPLRAPRRRSSRAPSFEERQAASTTPERILRALAEVIVRRGYPGMRLAEVVECAGVSQRTFYEHFASKDEAVLAAIDQGSSLMLASVLPAFRRAGDWEHGVRSALAAMFAFGAVEPEYARLGAVEIYAIGKPALSQRDRILAGMEALLAPPDQGVVEEDGEGQSIAAEASGGAVYALIYNQVKSKGPQALGEILPLATYVALAPFVGSERAYQVANE
jgi:AcrR family transcriptional regulator